MNIGCETSMQTTSKTIPNALTTFLDRGNFHNTCFEARDFLYKRSRSNNKQREYGRSRHDGFN